MLFANQLPQRQELYKQMLMSTGALSKLFSKNKSPYLVYRNVENAFCEAFDAEDLGRDDCSADASLETIGIGLKTFLHMNGRTLQKIAEFNKEAHLYRSLSPKDLILKVANLRNKRIEHTMRTYGFTTMIYQCVTRKPGKILIYEFNMDKIDIPNIKNINQGNKNTITFDDELNEYSFNMTKSTLYQRFITDEPVGEIDVEIIENPYKELAKMMTIKSISDDSFTKKERILHENSEFPLYNMPNYSTQEEITNKLRRLEELEMKPLQPQFQQIILPLFSDRGGRRHVPEKSGLNQWNASGRPRNASEIYVPIPSWIHNNFEDFFPERDVSFDLRLPDKSILSAKVCQENRKALMSNPNSALGDWLLRKVMSLTERELLTYEQLEILGIDSVAVTKHSEHYYSIEFCEIGSYDDFQIEHQYLRKLT